MTLHAFSLSSLLQGFYMLGAVTHFAMTTELMPLSLLGRWYGVIGLFIGLTSVIAPTLTGVIWDFVGPLHMFSFLILVQSLRVLILLTMPETLRLRRG